MNIINYERTETEDLRSDRTPNIRA